MNKNSKGISEETKKKESKVTEFTDAKKVNDVKEKILEASKNNENVKKVLETESDVINFSIGIKGDRTLVVESKNDKNIGMEDVILAMATIDVNNFIQLVNRGIISNASAEDVLNAYSYYENYRLEVINASIHNYLSKNAGIAPNKKNIYSDIINLLLKASQEFSKDIKEQQSKKDSGIIIPK